MNNTKHKDLIKKYYNEYKKIGYIECPALNYEKVYFNKRGFRHIIRKGKKLREIGEQIERLNLLKYAPIIIASSKNIKDYNKNSTSANNKDQYKTADFWSFLQIHDDIKIIVVIRQVKDGPKHFFSIMRK